MRACEIVFQDHKDSMNPLVWNLDLFKGRISLGLREMAKETLLQKKVIFYPNKAKRTITLINPNVVSATSYKEAIEMAMQKVVVAAVVEQSPTAIPTPKPSPNQVVTRPASRPAQYVYRSTRNESNAQVAVVGLKWYLRPFYYYFLWPLLGAAAGALVAGLLGYVVSSL